LAIRYPRGMKQRLLSKLTTKLLQFLYIQLFVTLISLPILVSWGLPISSMAPVGNLVFGPFLLAFLGISCLIFFTELLYIPNGVFIWCLEQLTTLWHKLLSFGSTSWLISMPKPSPWFFVLLLAATVAIVHHKRLRSPGNSSLCFTALLLFAYGYLYLINTPRYAIEHLPCYNKTITFIKTPRAVALIDPGVLGSRISAPSWVEYSLLPHLRSTYGTNCIDHVIVLAPGIVLFDAVAQLISLIPIKHIYVPFWRGENPRGLGRAFMKMKEAAQKHKVTLHRFADKPFTLSLGKKSSVTVEPLEVDCAYRTTQYPACCVSSEVRGEKVILYSSKYKIKT